MKLYSTLWSSPLVLSAAVVAQNLSLCARFYHQSTVKHNTLYIDGGLQDMIAIAPNGSQVGPQQMGYNNVLITIDLKESWDWKTNFTESTINKTRVPSSGTIPPSLENGALFQGAADDSRIWMYGGTTSWWNTSAPTFEAPLPAEYSLWSYDTSQEVWDQYDVSAAAPWRPHFGANTEAPDQGLAFFYNGELDSGSSVETQYMGDSVKQFLEGMVVLNTTAGTAVNISTMPIDNGQPRTRGVMQYIPNYGDNGILISFGGTYRPVSEIDSNVAANYVDMSEIDIFDISTLYNGGNASSGWYKQQATGNVPLARGAFCAVTVSAPDNSSHNIYIYGGLNEHSDTYYDDVYVLSLPSFTWTMMYGPGNSPRFGHTCHLVGNRQMLTVGGISNLDMQSCDWETKGVGILEMTTMNWTTFYNASASPYLVPQVLIDTIGGTPHGNATKVQPASGFNNSDFAQLFGVTIAASTTTPTTNATSTTSVSPTATGRRHHRSDTGAIVGGVVGGIVVGVLLAVGIFVVARRQKRKATAAAAPSDDTESDHEDHKMMPDDSHELVEVETPPAELAQQRGLYETQEIDGVERIGEVDAEGTSRWKVPPQAELVELAASTSSSGAS